MNFLRDWLHLWHERRYPCRKGSSNRDQSNRQDDGDNYICSDSDYASEDINEKDSLQNVLLITGPIGVRGNIFCQKLWHTPHGYIILCHLIIENII